ncbi:hypothetical protein C4D60_Mb02t09840 [Musa balbisiana]|uniref:Expansin-like EG45 domain-containing protein n=1 Tax=Musa balbisiana TaxID=52838 RepID=A0A4S8I9I3_MUSBA|nr:hypothetical protein C4D60_Mb02t09840 [Musa balbisiana]
MIGRLNPRRCHRKRDALGNDPSHYSIDALATIMPSSTERRAVLEITFSAGTSLCCSALGRFDHNLGCSCSFGFTGIHRAMIYTSLPCSGQASTTGMYKSILLPCLLPFLFLSLSPPSLADVGTAASYGPPYLRKTHAHPLISYTVVPSATACYGSDESQFPPNNLFAAAGDAIWDNDASCGRQYLVRCLSSATPGACMDGTVQVTIVDYAPSLVSAPSAVGATMVLSETAYGMISQSSANEINIEFTQV